MLGGWLMVLTVQDAHPRANHRFSFAGDPLLSVRVLLVEGEGVEKVGVGEGQGGEAGAGRRRREAVRASQSQRRNCDVQSDRLHLCATAYLLQSVLLLLSLLLRDETQNL